MDRTLNLFSKLYMENRQRQSLVILFKSIFSFVHFRRKASSAIKLNRLQTIINAEKPETGDLRNTSYKQSSFSELIVIRDESSACACAYTNSFLISFVSVVCLMQDCI